MAISMEIGKLGRIEFDDGTHLDGLDPTLAAELVKGEHEIRAKVHGIGGITFAERLAAEAGMRVFRVPDGVLLRQHVRTEDDPLPRGGVIALAPEEVFTSCEKALHYARTAPPLGIAPPARYHTDLTQTFLQGTPEGQVQSLWNDYRAYGMSIVQAKICAFMDYAAHTAPFDRYIRLIRDGVLPHHVQSHASKARVDQVFAKFWLLQQLVGK